MASGTSKRQRGVVVSVRFTEEEASRLDALSSRSGLAVGAFMRAAAFGDAGPRARRRPPVDHQVLRRLLGECGRIGNNINQIARRLNLDGPLDIPELKEALAAYLEIRTAIMNALAMDTLRGGEEEPRRGKDPRRDSPPMIIKGKSRGGPRQLATHLLRTDTNEKVKVLQLDSPTGDLREALRDWQFLSSGTQGTKGLYHAQINPDARYVMTPDQWTRTVDVLEKELGFEGQPRAVVYHEKEGRQHIHVVWQRTNIDSMTMVHDGHNYQAHERASLALEQEFGHEHVPGKHAKRDQTQEMPRAEFTHAEWQQGERTGIDPRTFKETVTAIYKASDTAQAFQAALEERGLILARGDRRPHVLVDHLGQVYSLTDQIKDVPRKELKTFMAGVDPAILPNIKEAKAIQQERQQQKATQAPEPPKPESTPEQPKPVTEETPKLDPKLEAAIRARHEQDGKTLIERQSIERQYTTEAADHEFREKLEPFDSMQETALARYDHEHAKPEGLAKWIEAARALFNPEKAAEQARQRQEQRDGFISEQGKARDAKITDLETARQAEITDMNERHEQQRREHAAGLGPELKRYADDAQEAQRLAARMEESRRLAEEQRQQNRQPGPDPPKFTQ